MDAVQYQPTQGNQFTALPVRNASFARTPAQGAQSAAPGLTPDGVVPLCSCDPTGAGTASAAPQPGGFLGLIASLIGQLDTYIQSLAGGTAAGGASSGSGPTVAVPGHVYLK